MGSGLLKLCVFATVCLSLAANAGPSPRKKAWITMGDAAFRQAKAVAPELVSVERRQLRVGDVSEKVHAIVLDEARLATVSGAIHQRLGQCGGFMYHASQGEARAALEQRRLLPEPRQYEIRQRELVEPLLASMQESHIASTILALSGFANRYYTSRSGVDASNWLLSTWRELAAGPDDIAVVQVTHPAWLGWPAPIFRVSRWGPTSAVTPVRTTPAGTPRVTPYRCPSSPRLRAIIRTFTRPRIPWRTRAVRLRMH